jgi:hypothetical protein
MRLLAATAPLHGGINREEKILKISNKYIHFEATRKRKYLWGSETKQKN